MRNILLLLSFFNFFSCSGKNFDLKELHEVIKSKRKIAFLQANKEHYSTMDKDGGFGDIFVNNLDKNKEIRLTDDNYYDERLSWSPDGLKLLFTSTRENNSFLLESFAYMGFPKLFTFNFSTGEIKRVFRNNTDLNNISTFCGLTWTNRGIFFSKFNNIIYNFNLEENTLRELIILPKQYIINNITISPNHQYMAIECMPALSGYLNKIGLYDFFNHSFKWIISGRRQIDVGTVGGWAYDSKSFLFYNLKLYSYSLDNDKYEVIDIPGNGDEILVSDCYYLDKNEIIYKMRKYQGDTLGEENKSSIAIYDKVSQRSQIISESSKYKDYLVPFINYSDVNNKKSFFFRDSIKIE